MVFGDLLFTDQYSMFTRVLYPTGTTRWFGVQTYTDLLQVVIYLHQTNPNSESYVSHLFKRDV